MTPIITITNEQPGTCGPTIQWQRRITPRNLVHAVREYNRIQKDLIDAFGNIGRGTTWIEVNGKKVHAGDIWEIAFDGQRWPDESYKRPPKTVIAEEIIKEMTQ